MPGTLAFYEAVTRGLEIEFARTPIDGMSKPYYFFPPSEHEPFQMPTSVANSGVQTIRLTP